MKILILAEHDGTELKSVNAHVINAALQLGDDIDVLVAGYQCTSVIDAVKKIAGVKTILQADAKDYAHQLPENLAELIAALAKDYNYVITGATTFGKNILPRAAALCDASMISDVMQIVASDTFLRPLYAGNVLATVKTEDPIKFLTIRSTAFQKTSMDSDVSPEIKNLTQIFPNTLSQCLGQELTPSTRPELTTARVIISGGRGLKNAENFQMLEKIADQLGAAIGASRAAVDAGFAPNDYQVGQTGKVVAPELYIAVGISGAIQHMAGMKDSKVIVAINQDADAPIFEIADYGLVGDLFKIMPELHSELDKLNKDKR